MSDGTIGLPPSPAAARERQRIVDFLKFHEAIARQRVPEQRVGALDARVAGVLLGLINILERNTRGAG